VRNDPVVLQLTRRRVHDWVRRYALAEIACTAAALITVLPVYEMTHSVTVACWAGLTSESIAYYGTLFMQSFSNADRPAGSQRSGGGPAGRILVGMALEFGPAEAIDLVLRPWCMAAGMWLAGVALGTFAGKALADVVFYVVVLRFQQLRSRTETPCGVHRRSIRGRRQRRRPAGTGLSVPMAR
jgi:hypothetical protein